MAARRRTASHVYNVFVVCLLLGGAGLIGGGDYLMDVVVRLWPFALGFAAFCAVFFIGGHYWPKLRLILYGAVVVAGAVLGVASGDEAVVEGLLGLAFLGVFIGLPVHVVDRRKRRRPPSPPAATGRLPG
jgi:hypothetical protein